jgi:ferric-dicitrate binding protein FerR (iron transport regulator)
MEYSDDDVAFAFRLLNERESLEDAEVEEWMRSPVHRRLMNDMEGVRQQWETKTGSGDEPERAAREERSRRMTLRWTIVLVMIMLALLVVSRVAWK